MCRKATFLGAYIPAFQPSSLPGTRYERVPARSIKSTTRRDGDTMIHYSLKVFYGLDFRLYVLL